MEAQTEKVTAGRILQVASRLFAERGYSNVSIRDVCRETDTTAPVIYYYFGSKRGLFDAVIRKKISMSDFIRRLTEMSSAKDPMKGLASFVRAYLSSFPADVFELGLYTRDTAALDKQSARRISGDLDKIHEITSKLIAKCIEKGLFRKTEPSMAADCLLGMLNRAVFQRIHFAKSADIDSYGNFVLDFFLRAMK